MVNHVVEIVKPESLLLCPPRFSMKTTPPATSPQDSSVLQIDTSPVIIDNNLDEKNKIYE